MDRGITNMLDRSLEWKLKVSLRFIIIVRVKRSTMARATVNYCKILIQYSHRLDFATIFDHQMSSIERNMTGVGHMRFCKQDTLTLTTFVMDQGKQMQTRSLFADISQQNF